AREHSVDRVCGTDGNILKCYRRNGDRWLCLGSGTKLHTPGDGDDLCGDSCFIAVGKRYGFGHGHNDVAFDVTANLTLAAKDWMADSGFACTVMPFSAASYHAITARAAAAICRVDIPGNLRISATRAINRLWGRRRRQCHSTPSTRNAGRNLLHNGYWHFRKYYAHRDSATHGGVRKMAAPLHSICGRWEKDIPEIGKRGAEFDGDEGALGVHLRGTHDLSFHLILGLGIFEAEFRAGGQAFGKNNHRAAGADRVCVAVDGLGPAGQVNDNAHAQKDALRAPALFIRLGTSGGCAALHLSRWSNGRRGWLLRRRHSSSPQKSISGAMS